MIIRGADGDDESKISEMETRLCRKYRLARKALYPTLAMADFHRTYRDPERFWTIASYAAFSGKVLTHKLDYKHLNALLADFASECQAHRKSWDAVGTDAVVQYSRDRQSRDHVAIAFRYACAMADQYVWPPADPYVAGKLTPAQLVDLNAYLEFVSTERKIPAGKLARLACQRQLDDLAKSYRGGGEEHA